MFGVGVIELIIIIVIAVVLFGIPGLLGYWLGYRAGRKASEDE